MNVMLKEIGDIITGNTPSKNSKEFWGSKDICFIKPDIIADSRVHEICESNEYISECARKKARIVSKDSIFVTCIGSIGKVGIAGEGEYAFNQQINAIVTNEKVNPRYLAYNLLYNKTRLIDIANAPVVPIINKSQFGEFIISIEFDINKQSRIVAILDKLSSLIEKYNREIITLDKLVRARFFELFGDLVEGDKIKDNRRKIGDIASVTKLAGFEFTKYIKYKDIGSIGDSDVIMLRGLNCKGGKLVLDDIKWIDRETSDLLPRSKLYVGDILITYAGTIGDIALVDEDNKYHLAPNVGKISIIDKLSYDPVFLVHLLMYSNKYIMSFASKVAQASINMQKIRNFEYYFPSFEEQKHFSTFVEQVNKSKLLAALQLQIHIYKTITLL